MWLGLCCYYLWLVLGCFVMFDGLCGCCMLVFGLCFVFVWLGCLFVYLLGLVVVSGFVCGLP